MYLDEITPGDSEVEFTNELTSIVDRLRLGAISKEEASNMIADIQADLTTRRALLDRTPEGEEIFLRLALVLKLVTRHVINT